jgi:hypothetical protein
MKKYTPGDYTRVLNKFFTEQGIGISNFDIQGYFEANEGILKDKKKVALTFICINPLYWQYIKDAVEGARKYFLPGHEVDIYLWSDVPTDGNPEMMEVVNSYPTHLELVNAQLAGQETNHLVSRESLLQQIEDIKNLGIKIFPVGSIEWPHPTLKRYHLYLQQEDTLKEYDFQFHCDIDMRFVGFVGDEILGEGLTAVQMPMYAVDKKFIPPYEPNPNSSAYIPRPGRIVEENGNRRFEPLYLAGGFQGGKMDKWLEAMKAMKAMIDDDARNGYIPIWNDETVWNKYLFNNPASIVLDPGYTYPDSLIEEYFKPLWGRDYNPKLITLTKRFSISKAGGAAVQDAINNMPK